MGFWSDFTGATAKRSAARGLENYNNQQADLYADRTKQQFGNLAEENKGQQLDTLGNASAWLDPSMAYQQAQATQGVLGAYGGSGKLFSGSAMKALSDRQQGIASQGWQQAVNNYMNQANANNAAAQQNFSNSFQTANMMNQADATRFNTATQGRANVASVQAPSAWDAMGALGNFGLKAAGAFLGKPGG